MCIFCGQINTAGRNAYDSFRYTVSGNGPERAVTVEMSKSGIKFKIPTDKILSDGAIKDITGKIEERYKRDGPIVDVAKIKQHGWDEEEYDKIATTAYRIINFGQISILSGSPGLRSSELIKITEMCKMAVKIGELRDANNECLRVSPF